MKYLRYTAFIIGASIALTGLVARLAIGRVYSSAEMTDLLSSLAASGLYLASAIVAGSSTILALILTILGMAKRSESDFENDVYRGIYRVALLATVSLVLGIFLLLCLTVPITKLDDIDNQWFEWLYNVLFALTTLCCSLVSGTAVLLFSIIRTIIAEITPLDKI